MALGIIALGHAGGVPGPYMGMIGNHGNTNFALVPNITDDIIEDAMVHLRSPDKWNYIAAILEATPYWLIDCGPETALRLCGALGQPPVAKNCQGIFLTHGHDDHAGGLKSMAYRCKFIEGTHPVLVIPSDALESDLFLQTVEFAYSKKGEASKGLETFFDVHVLDNIDPDGPHPWDVVGEVTHFVVDHNRFNENDTPMPAHGYGIVIPNGKIAVFSGDTAFPIESGYFRQADFVIHDVQFYDDGSLGTQAHCPYAALRDAVPPEHRRKVWLTHTGHELPPEVLADGFAGLFRQGRVMVLQ